MPNFETVAEWEDALRQYNLNLEIARVRLSNAQAIRRACAEDLRTAQRRARSESCEWVTLYRGRLMEARLAVTAYISCRHAAQENITNMPARPENTLASYMDRVA